VLTPLNIRETRLVLSAPVLGQLLVDAPPAILDQVRAELGPDLVAAVMALGRGPVREHQRLVSQGVNPATAAVLAAHHREN
jgi:hypothetical protein